MSQPAEADPARELEEADAELRKLGYHYNDDDELRSVDGGKEFVFVNQARGKLVAYPSERAPSYMSLCPRLP